MKTITIQADSLVSINIGNRMLHSGVLIEYIARRSFFKRTGSLLISCPFKDGINVLPDEIGGFDLIGLSFKAFILNDDVILKISVDNSSSSSVDFDYIITKIKSPIVRLNGGRKVSVNEPTLVLRFDDRHSVGYTKWYPFFTSKGIVGDLAIFTREGGITFDQLREMQDAGWTIKAHAWNNADHWAYWSEEDLREVFAGMKQDLIDEGLEYRFFGAHGPNLTRPTTPNKYQDALAREYFECSVSTVAMDAAPVEFNLHTLGGMAIDGAVGVDWNVTTEAGMALFKGVIDGYKNENRMWELAGHGWTQALQDGLEELIDYAQTEGVVIKSFRQAFESLIEIEPE